MLWATALSTNDDAVAAVRDVGEALTADLQGTRADLVVAFASPQWSEAAQELAALLAGRFPKAEVIGCTGAGVIGGGREVEGDRALAVTAASLPGVQVQGFHVSYADLPDEVDDPEAWRALLGLGPDASPSFIVLPDPYSFDPRAFLAGMDATWPGSVKLGGLASGGGRPGEHALFYRGEAKRSGAVGVALTGDVVVDTAVAQGCRPIGVPMFVTSGGGNIIRQLDGKPAVAVLTELVKRLPPADRALARHSLFVGVVMDDSRIEHRQGDFLIRNLMGVDPDTGAIAVATQLQMHDVAQFHLRDAQTSAEDLAAVLGRHVDGPQPAGALLFSCTGRGSGLYGSPDHDSRIFHDKLGAEVPLTGFFCNGEIGPVGGRTHLHGYTSSFGLFRPR